MRLTRLTDIGILIFSFIFSIGMLYALYTDINFFLTKRTANAKFLQITELEKSRGISFQVDYYNDYLAKNIRSSITLKPHDALQLGKGKNNQISIYYVKNYANKIYIENINVPRWPILIFELFMLFLMSFLIYTYLKKVMSRQGFHSINS